MDPAALRPLIEEHIAFAKKVGVLVLDASATESRLRLPHREDNTAPPGVIHAGATFTLAESAAAAVGLMAFDPGHFTFIAKTIEMRFRRPARADVWARAQLSHEDLRAGLSRASTEGKADVSVAVELSDQGGERLAEATVTLSLRRL